jgi:hypothetical protein
LLALGGVAEAACPAIRPAPVLVPGETITMSGGIPRGTRDCVSLALRAGQRLTITQSDVPDTNIVFSLYPPPWRVLGSAEDIGVEGKALPGTEEARDARHFDGTLRLGGVYLLVIGTSRGSGAYRLAVTAR